MIAMLIFGTAEGEIQYIRQCFRDFAGRFSEEDWEIRTCETVDELAAYAVNNPVLDMICIDVTTPRALEMAKVLRAANQTAYMILIANVSISPVSYMRPSIRAESLLLKPMKKEQVQSVLSEAFGEFMKRFESPDEEKVFVIENKEGRILVEYQSIHYFEARAKRVYLNTGAKEYGFYETLDHLQEQLAGQFLRCHRGFLVNKKKIREIQLSRNTIILKGGYEVPVSRTFRPMLKNYMQGDNVWMKS